MSTSRRPRKPRWPREPSVRLGTRHAAELVRPATLAIEIADENRRRPTIRGETDRSPPGPPRICSRRPRGPRSARLEMHGPENPVPDAPARRRAATATRSGRQIQGLEARRSRVTIATPQWRSAPCRRRKRRVRSDRRCLELQEGELVNRVELVAVHRGVWWTPAHLVSGGGGRAAAAGAATIASLQRQDVGAAQDPRGALEVSRSVAPCGPRAGRGSWLCRCCR
jgi:hypothetical protein